MTTSDSQVCEFPYALSWKNAACSEFAEPCDWKEWADRHIERSEFAELWIINLSIAGDTPALLSALRDQIQIERQTFPDCLVDVALGYLWLRYERGDLHFEDFLSDAGRFADNNETLIECEFFYALLNRLEIAITPEQRKVVEAEAASRLMGLRDEALRQWHVISVR